MIPEKNTVDAKGALHSDDNLTEHGSARRAFLLGAAGASLAAGRRRRRCHASCACTAGGLTSWRPKAGVEFAKRSGSPSALLSRQSGLGCGVPHLVSWKRSWFLYVRRSQCRAMARSTTLEATIDGYLGITTQLAVVAKS
jgi:hypothetical protein